jgi:hypothetical protein
MCRSSPIENWSATGAQLERIAPAAPVLQFVPPYRGAKLEWSGAPLLQSAAGGDVRLERRP